MVQIFQGDAAKSHNDFGLHDSNFGVQPTGGAKFAFLDAGRPVACRTAFDDVGGINAVACDVDSGEGFVKQLPGGADKRNAVVVLHYAGAFADQHQRAGRVAVYKEVGPMAFARSGQARQANRAVSSSSMFVKYMGHGCI